MAVINTRIAPTTRIMIPSVKFGFTAASPNEVVAGVGVAVFKLPAGRGVLVAGAVVGSLVGVLDGSGVRVWTPVTVGVNVGVMVFVGKGVRVGVSVRLGVGLGVATW